jgi:hypothetical protein
MVGVADGGVAAGGGGGAVASGMGGISGAFGVAGISGAFGVAGISGIGAEGGAGSLAGGAVGAVCAARCPDTAKTATGRIAFNNKNWTLIFISIRYATRAGVAEKSP